MLRNDGLRQYQENGFQQVEGWCREELFQTVDLLHGLDINQSGGCLEIGIHQGKFYILLNQVIAEAEKSYAVDVFDDQSLNIDGSGCGALQAFKENLEKYDVHKGKNTHILIGDSTDCGKLESVIGLGTRRFISIDGGHTVAHVLSDLQLSSRLLKPEGVVILDDILNYHWLGVIEGIGRYLDTFPTLVPFAIGHNKLYMCKLSYQKYYTDAFAQCSLKTKIVRFYGHDIVAL